MCCGTRVRQDGCIERRFSYIVFGRAWHSVLLELLRMTLFVDDLIVDIYFSTEISCTHLLGTIPNDLFVYHP